MNILLTGFEPFGGERSNPGWEAVRGLKGKNIEGCSTHVAKIPVAFDDAWPRMKKAIEETEPDIILSFGLAGKRNDITVEKITINVMDAKQEDNRGNKPTDEPILKHGREAYFVSIPPTLLVKALHGAKIPASVSYSAGTFLCNYLMYRTLSYIEEEKKDVLFSYIHLPYMHEQVLERSLPSMDLKTMKKAAEVLVRTSLSYAQQRQIFWSKLR